MSQLALPLPMASLILLRGWCKHASFVPTIQEMVCANWMSCNTRHCCVQPVPLIIMNKKYIYGLGIKSRVHFQTKSFIWSFHFDASCNAHHCCVQPVPLTIMNKKYIYGLGIKSKVHFQTKSFIWSFHFDANCNTCHCCVQADPQIIMNKKIHLWTQY